MSVDSRVLIGINPIMPAAVQGISQQVALSWLPAPLSSAPMNPLLLFQKKQMPTPIPMATTAEQTAMTMIQVVLRAFDCYWHWPSSRSQPSEQAVQKLEVVQLMQALMTCPHGRQSPLTCVYWLETQVLQLEGERQVRQGWGHSQHIPLLLQQYSTQAAQSVGERQVVHCCPQATQAPVSMKYPGLQRSQRAGSWQLRHPGEQGWQSCEELLTTSRKQVGWQEVQKVSLRQVSQPLQQGQHCVSLTKQPFMQLLQPDDSHFQHSKGQGRQLLLLRQYSSKQTVQVEALLFHLHWAQLPPQTVQLSPAWSGPNPQAQVEQELPAHSRQKLGQRRHSAPWSWQPSRHSVHTPRRLMVRQ